MSVDKPEGEKEVVVNQESMEGIMTRIRARIEALRGNLKEEAPSTMFVEPKVSEESFSGDAYVESVGTIVNFEKGASDFYYTPPAVRMRQVGLDQDMDERQEVFDEIASKLKPNSRVLNVGAGGDTTLIQSVEGAGHEIVSTDFSQETVNALTKRVLSPTFACDLVNLDKVLDPNSMDYIMGNSSMGYLDPKKMSKIVENLSKTMSEGAIFTFDLAPHPYYFSLADGEKKQKTSVNEAEADPAKILELIKKYGAEDGINAMAYFSNSRGNAVKLAVLEILKKKFEAQGLSCNTGIKAINKEGGYSWLHTLRVAKADKGTLKPIEGEFIISDIDDTFYNHGSEQFPWFEAAIMDRDHAESIAKELDIKTNRREAPWRVIRHIMEIQDSSKLPAKIRDEVLDGIKPSTLVKVIEPYTEGKEFNPPKKIKNHIAVQQTMYKGYLKETSEMGTDQIDHVLDQGEERYKQEEKEKRKSEMKREQAKKKKLTTKNARKRKKGK